MTKKEAFLAAVRGEVPDAVPVAPLIHGRFAHKVLGRADWRAVFEVHQMIGSTYHRGPLVIEIPMSLPDGYAWQLGEPQPRPEGGQVIEIIARTPRRTMTGKLVQGMMPHDPLVGKCVEYPIKCKADWLAYKDLIVQYIEHSGQPRFDGITEAIEAMGQQGIPGVGMVSAYSILGSACGMEQLMLDLHDEPDLMGELFELERGRVAQHVDAFLASPAELAWLDICWATGSNMSPEWFAKWALPDVVMVMEKVRQVPGKYMGLYTLGRVRKVLPMLVDAGVDFIETFEPNQGDITLAEAKKLYGGRVCLMGNFDCLVLARGTVDDARREARRCLDEAMAGGGYVMTTADEVPADAKMDNLKAMVETVRQFGRYS